MLIFLYLQILNSEIPLVVFLIPYKVIVEMCMINMWDSAYIISDP